MRVYKLEESFHVEALKSKIWSMFEILRSERIASEDYHVLLFLLSAYKDRLFKTEILNENSNLNERLVRSLHNSESELTNQYNTILTTFEPLVMRLSENGTRHIIGALGELNLEILDEHFADIFDSVLYRITQSQGRFGGEFIQPVELTRFICGLAELQPNSKVYNPFAGLASFGVYLDQGHYYLGQELNQKTWALGVLRIMAYQRPGTSSYVCDDSISYWPAASEKFDLIFANPPYGMRLGSYYREIEPEFRTVEQFLLEKGVRSLNENGKLIALLPQGILFRGLHEQRLREFLIDEDLIDTIISLPGGLLLNTGIPLIIMVLSKNKKIPGKVRFVDAKKFVDSKNDPIHITRLRERVLNDYGLNSILHDSRQDSDIVRFVSNDEIRAFDYNLSVPRYFRKQIDGVKLGEIIEYVRGQRVNLPLSGKLIRIRDLKDDKIDFRLNEAIIEDLELRRSDIYQISESCLLLAVRWKTLKPTLFEFKGNSVYRGQDILSFKVNEGIADKAFLINELHADYVQEQLESFRLGTSVMPFLRKDDLMNVVIKLPSLEEQRAKVQGALETYFNARESELALAKQIQGLKEDSLREFQSIKHTFRNYLSALKSNVSGTIKFISKNSGNPISLDMIYSQNLNQTFDNHLKSIYNSIDDLSKLLNNDIDFSNNTIEIDLLQIIKQSQGKFKNENQFIFEDIFFDESAFKDEEGNILFPIIKMNESDFNVLFSNVITNAVMHGFKNSKRENIIRTFVGLENEMCILEISNNGKPIPQDFTIKHLTTRGEKTTDSAGIGIGGADIKNVVEKHNGILELVNNPYDEFPVKYIFKFPFIKSIL